MAISNKQHKAWLQEQKRHQQKYLSIFGHTSVDSLPRFGGHKNAKAVEAFLGPLRFVLVSEDIADDDIIRGISLLFYGEASDWWLTVKNRIRTFKDFENSFKKQYSPKKELTNKEPVIQAVMPTQPPIAYHVVEEPVRGVYFSIGHIKDYACIDTCSKYNIASQRLYQHLLEEGHTFKTELIEIFLVDGVSVSHNVLVVQVDILLCDRAIPTTIIYSPNICDKKTIFCSGFLKSAGMILNFPKFTWQFIDGDQIYKLYSGDTVKLTDVSRNLECTRGEYSDPMVSGTDVLPQETAGEQQNDESEIDIIDKILSEASNNIPVQQYDISYSESMFACLMDLDENQNDN